MKKLLLTIVIAFLVVGCGLPASKPAPKSSNCNQGMKCSTSFDCGEIGVCYCQYDWLEAREMGALPQYGTCYFE